MVLQENTARRISLNGNAHGVRGRIIVYNADFIEILRPEEIMYVQAESNYCSFRLFDGTSYLASRTLGQYQEELELFRFVRPHQSFMVNVQYVRRIRKVPQYTLCMQDGKEIPMARARRSDIIDFLTADFAHC